MQFYEAFLQDLVLNVHVCVTKQREGQVGVGVALIDGSGCSSEVGK